MATKKTTTKGKKAPQKKKFFHTAPAGAEFWINYGSIVKDLFELKHALEEMKERTFEYHVNKEKNDFAKWVKNTLGEAAIAKKLEKAKTSDEMAKIIEEHTK